MTPTLVLVLVSLVVPSLAFILRILFRIHRSCGKTTLDTDWLVNFSAEPYRPMEALLGQEDFAFLSRQPGFDLALHKKLRRERLRIFRQYLNRLIVDFHRLHSGALALLALAPGDNSHVFARLVKLKWSFRLAVLRAETNYLLCCAGYRTLTVQALILRLEEMTAQTGAILAMPSAQAAVL